MDSKKKKKKKLKTSAASSEDKARAGLLLENGSFYEGLPMGALTTVGAEFVFHTGHTGYQEIMTDPSYRRQVIVFTAPQIGNQGVHAEDAESSQVWASGCVMRDYSPSPRHWRQDMSLDQFLREQAVPGLYGVDTRRLVLELREKGSMRGVISTETADLQELQRTLNETSSMEGLSLTGEVTTPKSHSWSESSHSLLKWGRPSSTRSDLKRCAVVDFGVKRQILRYLVDVGFEEVKVFPAGFTADQILSEGFDCVLLSNGPGDPSAETHAIEQTKKLIGKLPLFGICLGHQILGLALGLKTYKLKFGHHAANHPVKNLRTDRVEVSSQNHGFAVERSSTIRDLDFHFLHMNDESLAGFWSDRLQLCGLQFHPEASPGPLDSTHIFENFKRGSFDFG